MSPEDDVKQIKFRYIFDESYNPAYVNGVFGGIGPKGEIVMNFFLERVGLPHKVTHRIEPSGAVGEMVSIEPPEQTIVRFVSNGVVFNVSTAKAFHKWLGNWIEKAGELEATLSTDEGKE